MGNLKFRNITLFEYIIFIHSLQLASGMLIMPSPLATTAGTDGWISIIFGWFITSIIGVFIILILQKHPNKNFLQILTTYFGKCLGTIFILLYAFYLFFAGFNTLLKATDIVKVWIFPSTPSYQIAILLLLPFIVLARSGLRALTSYSMLVFFFTAWMPIFLLFSLKSNYNPLHLLPIFTDGIYPIVKATKETITPYAGLEITYFIYPFLQKKDKAVKGIILANTYTMFFYLYVTILSYIYFSPEGIKEVIWPAFHLLQGVRFSFLERLEIIYIAYYLIVFSTTIYPYLFFCLHSMTGFSHKLTRDWIPIIFILLIFGLFIFLNPNVSQFLFIYSLMDILNIVFFILLPIFFFVYSILFTWLTRRRQL
ncbi:spore germination protein (amino acid permease) [Bacillus cereus HuB4-4]|uniref:Spore germination protein (Amino acid permease) n=1 Tax=Bacillus cereus HuB4-4 TaxID=1053211 RepID=A0A9W5QWI7_BACCE|nr:endospore germination permease [Bacillus cereus]EOP91868.1 spore germination protein (amino acid permease) [Bacillus cereus HuB4-4]